MTTPQDTPQKQPAGQPTKPRIHPERKRRVRRALLFFSIAAWVTGVMLLALCTRMVCQYLIGMDIPGWATKIAAVHGYCYMVFVICTLNLGVKARWQPRTWIITALCGVVPFLSFFVEYYRRREVTEKFDLNS